MPRAPLVTRAPRCIGLALCLLPAAVYAQASSPPTTAPPAEGDLPPAAAPGAGAVPEGTAAAAAPPAPAPPPPAPATPAANDPDRLPAMSGRAQDANRRFSTTVLGERPMSAASAFSVRDQDLRLRPLQRVGDLLRVVPGLITVQHAGGGKANQYLIRGFDADHGTDFSLNLDGVPINMVTHGHGQGYSDTNFIIPELIERIEVYKGPYFAEWGDFATAGAANLVTRKRFFENSATVSGGMFNTLRAVGIASPSFEGDTLSRLHPVLAVEFQRTDGPFLNPENFNRYNVFGKLSYDFAPNNTLSLTVTAYGGDWRASGQIPSREVDAGRLDFFGNIDPTEGGTSSRYNVYLNYSLRPDTRTEFNALAYVTSYDFKLYSNFTLFSSDPVNGDQIEQGDTRTILGARMNFRRRSSFGWFRLDTSIGASLRHDAIHNTLFHDRARSRLNPLADNDVQESLIGGYLKEEAIFSRWARLIVALRADLLTYNVVSNLEQLPATDNKQSGTGGAFTLSPKATLVISPHRTTDVFINFGRGFHSNDVRGAVRSVDPVTPLTAALGYEIGARTRLLSRIDLAASLWGLDLDQETVWSGDEGTTEVSAASRRLGVEFEGRARILSWLFADLDVTYSDSKYRQNAGNGESVALAPRLTIAAGLSALTSFGLRGSLRFTGISDRPATEDGFLQAQGSYLLDAFVAYRWRLFEVGLSVENLTNARYKQAQFATTSRLPSEAPTSAPPPANACPAGTRTQTGANGNFTGCEDINFSPGNPINVQATATVYF